MGVKLPLLMARQPLDKIQLEIADPHNQWRNDILAKFSKIPSSLAELVQQIPVSTNSAEGADPVAQGHDAETRTMYVIIRALGGLLQPFPAAWENGEVQAGGEPARVVTQAGQCHQ